MLNAIIIVILLVIIVYTYRVQLCKSPFPYGLGVENFRASDISPTKRAIKKGTMIAENKMMQEHMEGCNSEYIDNPYGAPDANFMEWVTANGVDSTQVENHRQFVEERMGKGSLTGRTFTPDMHDSYDPSPWVGLRRPRYVPVDESTARQLQDVDYKLFEQNTTLRWGDEKNMVE